MNSVTLFFLRYFQFFYQTFLIAKIESSFFYFTEAPCSTPDGKTGRCIGLRDCQPLFALLQKKPLLAPDRDFLARSQCGYQNNSPYVSTN